MLNIEAMMNQNSSMNTVSINGVEVANLNDSDCEKLFSILRGMSSVAKVSAPSKTLSIPEETTRKPIAIEGKKVWQEDFLTVTNTDKQYRLYITCPIGGEKGKKVRYAIKASAKEYGAKFGGNFDSGDIYWVFPSKSKADEFIKVRKAYTAKAEK